MIRQGQKQGFQLHQFPLSYNHIIKQAQKQAHCQTLAILLTTLHLRGETHKNVHDIEWSPTLPESLLLDTIWQSARTPPSLISLYYFLRSMCNARRYNIWTVTRHTWLSEPVWRSSLLCSIVGERERLIVSGFISTRAVMQFICSPFSGDLVELKS